MTNDEISKQLNRMRITMQASQSQLIELMNRVMGCANLCEQLMGEMKKLETPEITDIKIEEVPDGQD